MLKSRGQMILHPNIPGVFEKLKWKLLWGDQMFTRNNLSDLTVSVNYYTFVLCLYLKQLFAVSYNN